MATLNKELDPKFARAFGVCAGVIGFLILYFFFASLAKLVRGIALRTHPKAKLGSFY